MFGTRLVPLAGDPMHSPTLDRLVNRKGYIPGNVWVICHEANLLKRDATLHQLEKLVAAIKKQVAKPSA